VVNPSFWAAVVAGAPAFERWSGCVYWRLPLVWARKARLYVGIGLAVILLMMPFSILYLIGLHPFNRVNNLVSFFLCGDRFGEGLSICPGGAGTIPAGRKLSC